MPENITCVQQVFTRNSSKSVKWLSQQLGLKETSTLTTVQQDLKNASVQNSRCNSP
jgi:hypothetical protein